jgi:predicted exporter
MIAIKGKTLDVVLHRTQILTRILRDQGAHIKSISDWQQPKAEQKKNIALIKANWDANHYKKIRPYLETQTIHSMLMKSKPIPFNSKLMVQNIGLDIQKIAEDYWTILLLKAPLTHEQKNTLEHYAWAQSVHLVQAFSQQLGDIRNRILYVALFAMLIIFIVLALYFGLSSAFIMLIIPAISAGMALYFSLLIQSSLNIFNVLACLLIITLAMDYVVFFRAHGVTQIMSHTISLSALSSALTFGIMSLSQTPAVSSFGLTLLIGLFFAWGLSHVTPFNRKKSNF